LHDIKTRQIRKDIKKLDKTADLSRHLQNATIRTKEQTESPEHGDYVGEARDKVQDTAKTAGNAAVRATGQAAKGAFKAAKASAQFTVKVAKLTVKATAAVVRGLLVLAGIGGPGLVLVVIVIAVAALIASPFGILFSGDNTD
jgi:hypothetical protein